MRLACSHNLIEMMQSMMAAGLDEKDHGGLALHYEKLNGFALKD